MSDNEINMPSGSPAMAPLSGVVQSFIAGSNLVGQYQDQRQAAADAADQRAQQQANLDRQFQFQQQQAGVNQQNVLAERAQALDIANRELAQRGSQFDAGQAANLRELWLRQFSGFRSDGYDFNEAIDKTRQSMHLADPSNPLSNIPAAHVQGYPLPVVLHRSDPVYPGNQWDPNTSPIGKFIGDNGAHYPGTPASAGQNARLMPGTTVGNYTPTPAGNIAQTAQGGGYPMPAMGGASTAQPQQQASAPVQQAPMPTPAQPAATPAPAPVQPAMNPQQVQGALNPLPAMMGGGAPSQPPMGGGMPAPVAAPAPVQTNSPQANAALQQQTQQAAAQLIQQSPDLPGKPADGADVSPDYRMRWEIANQKYHADIQTATDNHNGALAAQALASAQAAETQARTKQIFDNAERGKDSESLQNGLLRTEIDAKKLGMKLDQIASDRQGQSIALENESKRLSNKATRLLQQQAQGGQLGADSYADIQKGWTGISTHQQKTHDYQEGKLEQIAHIQSVLGMENKDFVNLFPGSLDPKDPNSQSALIPGSKPYEDLAKLHREWQQLNAPLQNPSYNKGAPQHMAQQGIPPTVPFGKLQIEKYQRDATQAESQSQTAATVADHLQKQLKALQDGTPAAARSTLSIPSPLGTGTVQPPPATTTAPKAGAKGTPTGTTTPPPKKAPPATAKPATKVAPTKSAPSKAPGASGSIFGWGVQPDT